MAFHCYLAFDISYFENHVIISNALQSYSADVIVYVMQSHIIWAYWHVNLHQAIWDFICQNL